MLTEKSKLSAICCFFFENIVLEFWPAEMWKVVLSKIKVFTPWFSEIAKNGHRKICIQSISMITADILNRI